MPWPATVLSSKLQANDELARLASGSLHLCRGHAGAYGTLIPSIDRGGLRNLPRLEKLKRERQSIDLLRSTAQHFASDGEKRALTDDITALMVLRHYGVPTRLLDWSKSPYVAAYFAVQGDDADGELWAFDHMAYQSLGKRQWIDQPETTTDGSGADDKFDAKLTAFTADEVRDWFCCGFYLPGFPRQNSQAGCYSLTRLFGVDHAVAIAGLLKDVRLFHRYIIEASIKPALRAELRDKHLIWRGSLFPDSAGAAETVRQEIFLGSA
jgi:hypothetical protein